MGVRPIATKDARVRERQIPRTIPANGHTNNLVDLKGFEPLTSSMPWKRAPNCATGPHGDEQPHHTTCSFFTEKTLPSSYNSG